MNYGAHRFTVDRQGEVTDREVPSQRDAEFYQLMNESGFRIWERKNAQNLCKVGLFLILFSVICFVEGSESRDAFGFWAWLVGGALLAVVGIPVTIYAGRIFFLDSD